MIILKEWYDDYYYSCLHIHNEIRILVTHDDIYAWCPWYGLIIPE